MSSFTLSRRGFLLKSLGLSSVVVSLPYASVLDAKAQKALETSMWKVIAEVQEHLFPVTQDFTGAKGISAPFYLYAAFKDPKFDYEIRDFITKGATWLEEEASERYKKSFFSMGTDEKERFLREIEEKSRWAQSWLSYLLTYTLEALLSDPIHGGNPKGAGWKWLEHEAGLPRPTKVRFSA